MSLNDSAFFARFLFGPVGGPVGTDQRSGRLGLFLVSATRRFFEKHVFCFALEVAAFTCHGTLRNTMRLSTQHIIARQHWATM